MKILISHNPKFVPLIQKLAADRDNEIVVTHQQFIQTLANLDIKATPLIAGIDNQTRQEANQIAAKMIADLHRFRPKMNGLTEDVKKFIKEDLAGYLYRELGDAVLFTKGLDVVKPDVIIIHNDVEALYRVLAFWGQANNRPCLHVPHAIYQDIENPYDIHRIVTATHLASAGPYQSKWYAECGMEPKNIFESGLPQFDEYAVMELDKQRAKQGLRVPQDKPIIMYASSWRQDTNLLGMHDGVEETYRAILECSKLMPDVHFLIKTHPHANTHAQWHLNVAREAGAKVTVTPHHLPQCLQASDLLFAYGPSNILLEGAHIPWLRLGCSAGYRNDPEIYKVNTDPPNVNEMIAAFYEILKRPVIATNNFLRKYLGPCDGQNTNRIANLIKGLSIITGEEDVG